MQDWIEFWKWTFAIMAGLFYLIVLVIIPLGARDLVQLFRPDRKENDEPE